MYDKMFEPLWYETKWAVGVLCLILPPVGLFLLFKSAEVSRRIKQILVIVFLLFSLVAGYIEYSYGYINVFYHDFAGAVYRIKGELLFESGDHEKALVFYRKAILHQPLNSILRLEYGVCFEKLKQRMKAVSCYVTARQLAIGEDPVAGPMNWYNFLKDKSAIPWGLNEIPTIRLIHNLVLEKRIDLAQKYMVLLQSKSGDTLSLITLYSLAKAELATSKGEFQIAENELRIILNSNDSAYHSSAYKYLARLEVERGNLSKAVSSFSEALRLDEKNTEIATELIKTAVKYDRSILVPLNSYIRMVRLRSLKSAAGEVIKVMSSILEKYPDFVYGDGCMYVKAYCLMVHKEMYMEAVTIFEELIIKYPKSESFGKALWMSYLCYKEVGLPGHEIKVLEKMISSLGRNSSLRGDAKIALREINRKRFEKKSKHSINGAK